MNALESRKQLLIAESELNRAQALHELQTIGSRVRVLVKQARTAGSIASAVASLVAGLLSFCSKKAPPTAEKPSKWQTLGKVAGMVSTLWAAFRTPPKSSGE